MIKVIIFDWGGICSKGKLAQTLSKQLAPKLKRHPKQITDAYLKYCYDYQISKINAKQFWKKVQEELGTKLKHEQLKHEQLIKYHINARQLNKGVIEIIKKLRKKYRLMLVTNTYKEYFEHSNKKYGITFLFNDVITSHIIKSRKPDLKIYKIALQRAKCKASECVFMEDKEKHLKIPKKLGMKIILYKSQKQLKEQLKKLGVVL